MYRKKTYKKILAILACMASAFPCNSQTWSSVGGGTNSAVPAMEIYQNKLVVTGGDTFGSIPIYAIASWDGYQWDSLGGNTISLSGGPETYGVYNNELYAGGNFWVNGVSNTYHIARWNGVNWYSCTNNTDNVGQFDKMISYNSNLFIAGDITKINGVSVNRIAKWNGSTWSGVSGGVTGGFMTKVYSMVTLNNKLYVAGDFTFAGGTGAFNIASWDGTQWSALDTGVNEYASAITADTVNNIIYVAGAFNIVGGTNGINVNYIAGWNGNNWFNLGQGLSGGIYCMTMYHGELYVGGSMIIVGSDSATIYIAKWNGSQWSKVLGPNNTVFTMQVYNDTLYVGGLFSSPGNNIARYYDTLTTVTEEKKTEQEYLCNNIPNPFGTTTVIPYYIPPGSKGIMTISDIEGKPIKTYILTENNNNLEVSLTGFKNGVYFYTLNIDDGRIIRHKKMILNW